MKLLLLSDPSNPHTTKWANALHKRGIEVFLFGLNKYNQAEYCEGIKIDYFNTSAGLKSINSGNIIKMIYMAALPRVKKIINKFKPDIIHSHYATSYGLLGALCKTSRFYISVWGAGDIFEFPRKSKIYRHIYEFILRKANIITTTSEVMRKEISRYTDKIIYKVPFGVDTIVFKPLRARSLFDDSEIVIGSVKSLKKNYGLEYLLRAFKIVADKLNSFPLKLCIVGGGPLYSNLRVLAEKLEIQNNTVFVRRIPYKDIQKYHNMIDISVFPSIVESFGVSVLEASACAKPVIASKIGGLPEVVREKETGYLVPAKNLDALAYQLENLILNNDLRKTFGHNGRRFVKENYEWNHCVNQMMSLYEERV